MKSFLYVMCVATACQPIYAAVSGEQGQQAQSAKVIAWAQQNLPLYTKDMDFAKHAPPAEIPVPPQLDPPCRLCGNTDKTQGETEVDSWIKRAEEPERTHIQELVGIERQLAAYRALSAGSLSPAAEHALLQFDSTDRIEEAIIQIANRLLYDKALPMGRKYDKEPKRAYAGILFLLDVARNQQLIQALKTGSDRSGENDALALVNEWVLSIASAIDKNILAGHQYNLCPVYADIMRQAEMAGGAATDMQKFQATIAKMDKLLRFNVNMKLHAVGSQDDGSHYDITWSATALLHLKIDFSKGCYTAEFLNDGKMAVKVDRFTMVTSNGAPVELTSARSFQAPIGKPTLNLCDPNPVLLIPFNMALMPKETLSGEGHTAQGMLLGSFLTAVVSMNDLITQDTNDMTGRNGAGPATPDNDSTRTILRG